MRTVSFEHRLLEGWRGGRWRRRVGWSRRVTSRRFLFRFRYYAERQVQRSTGCDVIARHHAQVDSAVATTSGFDLARRVHVCGDRLPVFRVVCRCSACDAPLTGPRRCTYRCNLPALLWSVYRAGLGSAGGLCELQVAVCNARRANQWS